mgnify:CR=1 FL=1
MQRRAIVHLAFIKSLPILCSYIFLGMAYGILHNEAGLAWYWDLVACILIYSGTFQFVLTTLLSGGASLITIAVTCFFVNSRQAFYSLTLVEPFRGAGKLKPVLVHALTDESYAVGLTIDLPRRERQLACFFLNLFSWIYWTVGGVTGALIGMLLPFSMEGIDFCMTALFVIIAMDQWQKASSHVPALTGLVVAVLCLLCFGADEFMLPALVITSVLLLVHARRSGRSPGRALSAGAADGKTELAEDAHCKDGGERQA